MASGPRRIMSSKVVEEVVCQCDNADRSVPPQIIKGKLDRMITKARELGKDELIEELKSRWDDYNSNPDDGNVSAELGAAIAIAGHELYPGTRKTSRLCPNCMIDLPTSLLFCPQCKGDFVCSGSSTQSQPMTIDLTKEQIEELIREKDKELGETIVEEDEEQARGDDGTEGDPMGQTSADYSPDENKDKSGDATMESTSNQWDDQAEEEAVVVEDDEEEDEMDSLQVNHDRYPIDLPKISRPANCTDVELKACRYLLFKLAKYATDHFIPWRKHVLEKTDRQKRETDTGGLRHDITGKDHAMEMKTVVKDGVEKKEPIYKDALYVTVSDETALEHYRKALEEGRTSNTPDENLRRYRFSVVINKLTETLYRLGYELDKDGDFGAQVKICNTAGEPTGDAVTLNASEMMRAYGSVEHAMRDAITHAFDAPSFSFFSEAQTFGHHKFNIQEHPVQGQRQSEQRTNAMHLMHYYGVEHVPLFRKNMERVYARDADEPQQLKFLANSPLASRQGFNMLMPVSANTAAGENAADDIAMNLPEETTVLEASSYNAAQPDPPDELLIEDYEEKEEESANEANENDPVVSLDDKRGNIERVTSGPVRDEHQPPR